MPSIVTGILSSTVGLLWNKTRDWTAAKLNDGDITDARIREIVVRELNDIKTKLDGLSRKDLLTSYRFFKEGVDLLSICLDKSKFERKAARDPIQEDRGEAAKMSGGMESEIILNKVLELSNAMGKMKICSDKEFESAKERFKDARKKATEAFCNEALSTQDRIFAAKLRVISEILECLENLETGITGCLSFLQELHSLPAVHEIFAVYLYLNGGVKSLLNKAERVENVKSVMLINSVLCNLNFKFSRKFSDRVTWPGIELTDRSFNPILDWQQVSSRKSMGEDLLRQPPNKVVLNDGVIHPYISTVTSHGDVIAAESLDDDNIKVVIKTGESKVLKLPNREELQDNGIDEGKCIVALAVDNNNNIYVLRWFRTRTENGCMECYMLYVLDENYNVIHVCKFDVFEEIELYDIWLTIAIDKNNNMIVMNEGEPDVFICENTGKLKRRFKPLSLSSRFLGISNENEIMVSSSDCTTVHLYSEEGNLKSTIKLPEGHRANGIAFHHVICRIIVLTYVSEKYFLLCYSETGELETSTLFRNENDESYPTITSHPSGPVAVVGGKTITFIYGDICK